jgi:hypothetical protein
MKKKYCKKAVFFENTLLDQEQVALELIKANQIVNHFGNKQTRYSDLNGKICVGDPGEFKRALWRLAGKGIVKVTPWCYMQRTRGMTRDPSVIRII